MASTQSNNDGSYKVGGLVVALPWEAPTPAFEPLRNQLAVVKAVDGGGFIEVAFVEPAAEKINVESSGDAWNTSYFRHATPFEVLEYRLR